MTEKRPKWDIATAITKGNEAIKIGTAHKAKLENRMRPGELQTLKAQTRELEARRSGQAEVLVKQKSQTGSQNEAAKEAHGVVMELRDMVKANTSDAGITKAFGVGEVVRATVVSEVVAAANMIFNGYDAHTTWAQEEAGIIQEDMDELKELLSALGDADTTQEQSKLNRKLTTMDKDVLQRVVEDTVTKISAIGKRVFGRTDPALAKVFADLIPNSN